MAGKFTYYDRVGGSNQAPTIVELPIADSQTLVAGDLVVKSSNKIAKAGASTDTVMGIMAEDVTTGAAAGGPLHKVAIIEPDHRYIATADADASSIILGAKLYDINATTQTVDVADATDGCIFVWKVLNTAGTSVLVSFSVTDYGY